MEEIQKFLHILYFAGPINKNFSKNGFSHTCSML